MKRNQTNRVDVAKWHYCKGCITVPTGPLLMEVIQHLPPTLDGTEHLIFLGFPLWSERKLAGLDQSLGAERGRAVPNRA